MEITFKLYAALSQYLPANADKHSIKIGISEDDTAYSLLDKYNVPREAAHIVLLNGIFIGPEEMGKSNLADGDTLAVWPPVAGG